MTTKYKTIKIHGKDYVEVKERILFLSENFEGKYSITSDPTYYPERLMWVVKATLTIKFEDGERIFTGLAQEIESKTGINQTSALENAETSAVGRACAMAGIGIVDGIASVDEINKANNRKPSGTAINGFEYSTGISYKTNPAGKTWYRKVSVETGEVSWIEEPEYSKALAGAATLDPLT